MCSTDKQCCFNLQEFRSARQKIILKFHKHWILCLLFFGGEGMTKRTGIIMLCKNHQFSEQVRTTKPTSRMTFCNWSKELLPLIRVLRNDLYTCQTLRNYILGALQGNCKWHSQGQIRQLPCSCMVRDHNQIKLQGFKCQTRRDNSLHDSQQLCRIPCQRVSANSLYGCKEELN